MKSYRLIKIYPDYTLLGMTSTYDYSEYPEFWEEIKSKDYEVLTWKHNNGDISSIKIIEY